VDSVEDWAAEEPAAELDPADEVPEGIPDDASEDAAEDAAEGTSVDAVDEAPEDTAEEASVDVAEEAPDDMLDEAPQNAADEAPEDAAEEASVNVAEEAPDDTTDEAPGNMAEEAEQLERVDEGFAILLHARHQGPGVVGWTRIAELPTAETDPLGDTRQRKKLLVDSLVVGVHRTNRESVRVDGGEGEDEVSAACEVELRRPDPVARPSPSVPVNLLVSERLMLIWESTYQADTRQGGVMPSHCLYRRWVIQWRRNCCQFPADKA
jgi:hypothetical protein